MAEKDTHLEILSAHYSETFALLKSAVERRDRLFLYILGVIFLLLLYMSAPTAMSNWLNLVINSKTGPYTTTTNLIESSFVGAILLLGLLSVTHTYFQTVLHIERQYDYVYELEEQLCTYYDGKAFIREGLHYRKYRRLFSRWTKGIFWVLFPVLYIVFIVLWLRFLYTQSGAPLVIVVVDSLITVSILVSLSLYLLALTRRR